MTTKGHSATFYCPNCKTWNKAETAFGQWIRDNPHLDAQAGYCVIDEDYIIHEFRTALGRDFQLMMTVEIKTLGSDVTDAQRDTIHMLNQVIRNRRQTPTKELKFQAGTAPIKVFSTMNGRYVNLRHYGVHVLRFSGNGPVDSKEIWWDKRPINPDILTSILKFDLDPDTLNLIDLRNHHSTAQASLPIGEDGTWGKMG